MRPASLAAVAEQTLAGASFDLALRDFLDEARAQPGAARICAEPARLRERAAHGDLMDAYLAATAESLAAELGLACPPWVDGEGRALRRPWFAVPWQGLRAVLLIESPAPFRARNLFVSANALSRA